MSWKASLQYVVALSTTEAEYIAATEAAKEALWMKGIVAELGVNVEPVIVFCDSQSAIHLSKNQVYHEKTKHIDVRMHFLRDEITKGLINLKKIPTEENPADVLIKSLPSVKFNKCLSLMGIQAT